MRSRHFWIADRGIFFTDDATDEDLAVLDTLPDFEHVAFSKSPGAPRPKRVTATGFAHLKGLSKLRELLLVEVGITDEGVAAVESLTNLRELWLDGN